MSAQVISLVLRRPVELAAETGEVGARTPPRALVSALTTPSEQRFSATWLGRRIERTTCAEVATGVSCARVLAASKCLISSIVFHMLPPVSNQVVWYGETNRLLHDGLRIKPCGLIQADDITVSAWPTHLGSLVLSFLAARAWLRILRR